ncbi:MAG TPA: endonuclease III [Phycisphaerae bacterium]|nr:endonuclease III [Phycisphaerae bacterium]
MSKKKVRFKPTRAAKKKRPAFRESPDNRIRRAKSILKLLHELYPDAECALDRKSALELLVATVLSAQCTDVRVNMVTPEVFKLYKTARDFANAKPAELEQLIKSTGFFRNKTKSLIGAGKTIVERFGGEVPGTMAELLEIPGVARKTANVILGTWFKKNEGVVVDTHIGRLAHRLRLTWRSRDDKDAVKIEQDLMEIIPREDWTFIGHALIFHGRQVCSARSPACDRCKLAPHCPSAFTFGPKSL